MTSPVALTDLRLPPILQRSPQMTHRQINWFAKLTCLGVFCLLASPLAAQPGQGVKIEPYTGPPILLPVPAEPPKPSPVSTTETTRKHENGKLWIKHTITRYSDDSIVSNGPYSEYFETGKIFVEGAYSQDAATGVWTYYHPGGAVAKKVTFKKGRPDGTVEVYREDGSLLSKRVFKEGKRAGSWETFASDGKQLKQLETYNDGKPDGVLKVWFENGNLEREINFKQGKRDGVSTEWYETGVKKVEVHFKDGKRDGPFIRWTSTGDKSEQTYKDGKRVRN